MELGPYGSRTPAPRRGPRSPSRAVYMTAPCRRSPRDDKSGDRFTVADHDGFFSVSSLFHARMRPRDPNLKRSLRRKPPVVPPSAQGLHYCYAWGSLASSYISPPWATAELRR